MFGEFTKNTLITFAVKIATIALFAAITIVIARVLGPEEQGIYSLAVLLPTFLLTFNNFGISQASVYYIAKRKYAPREIFGNNILFTFLISGLAMIIGLAVVFFRARLFPGVDEIYLVLAFFTFPLYLFMSFLNNILLGLKEIKKFNAILFLQPFLFLLLLLAALLAGRFGIVSAITAEIFSLVLTGSLLFAWVRKEAGGVSFKFNRNYFKEAFSFGGKIYLANFFSFVQQRASMFLANIYINPAAAGLYAVAAGTAEKLWMFAQSAELMLFQKVASEDDPGSLKEFTPLLCRNFLLVTAAIAAAFFFASRWLIIVLFSPAYAESVLPFQILLAGVVAVSGGRILANDIAGRGKPMINAYLAMGTAVLNVVSSLILIPEMGIGGAAWATVFSYTILFILELIIYSKVSGNRIADVVFVKRSDAVYYRNLFAALKGRMNRKDRKNL